MSIYTASVPVYRGYTFPVWSIVLGWCLVFSSVAAVPIVAFCTWWSKGTKAISVTPSKSPKKPGSVAGSTGCGLHSREKDREATKRLTPQNQVRTISVNYTCNRGIRSGLSDLSGEQMATTHMIVSPNDHRINDNML